MTHERDTLEQRLSESERFLRAITDNVPVRLAYFDLNARFRFVNRALCERYQRKREQMVGYSLAEIVSSNRDTPVGEHYRKAVAGIAQRFEYADQVNGETRHILTQLIPDVGADTRVQGVFGVGVDITHLKNVEQSLREMSATLNAIIEAIPALVSVWDINLRCRLVNRAFESFMGVTRENVVGRTLEEVLGKQEYARSQPWIVRALAGETLSFEKEFFDSDRSRHLTIHYIPLRLQDGSIAGFVGVAQDITAHREENLRLSLLSYRDPLTGLLNRAGFHEFLAEVTQRGHGNSLAVLYIDLDHFKPINDTHGHASGDTVLREFADRLLCLASPTDAVARLGGDEFAIAMTGAADIKAAAALADKVVETARQPIQAGNLTLAIGASVGVAVNADREGGWGQLIARADAMAYQAKAAGRGRSAIAGRSKDLDECRYG